MSKSLDDSFCHSDIDVQKYICPCDYLKPNNFGFQKGGKHCGSHHSSINCLGTKEIPLGQNPGCNNFIPTPSEIAWDVRYEHPPDHVQKGGRGDKDYNRNNKYNEYKKYKKYKSLYKKLKQVGL